MKLAVLVLVGVLLFGRVVSADKAANQTIAITGILVTAAGLNMMLRAGTEDACRCHPRGGMPAGVVVAGAGVGMVFFGLHRLQVAPVLAPQVVGVRTTIRW